MCVCVCVCECVCVGGGGVRCESKLLAFNAETTGKVISR